MFHQKDQSTMDDLNNLDDDYDFYQDAINFSSQHFTTLEDGKLLRELDKHYCATNWYEIDMFVKDVSEASESKIKSIVNKSNNLEFSNNSISKRYQGINELQRSYDPDLTYGPHVQLFYDVANETLNDPATVEEFQRLVIKIREETQTNEFKKKASRRKERLEANEKAALAYINLIFENHARLLILRIDLRLKMPGTKHMDQHKAIREKFAKFLNNRRSNKFFNHELGYIWKFEDGELLGGHYHLLVILDGSHVQHDEYIASQIGEYWNKITNNEGSYFNVNSKKHLNGFISKDIGIGVGRVESHDTEKRSHLTRVVKYFFKMEQYVEVKLYSRARSFGTGKFKTRTTTSGRPRKAKKQ